jgi:hypothetical protein
VTPGSYPGCHCVWASQLSLRVFSLWGGVDNRASRRVAEKLGTIKPLAWGDAAAESYQWSAEGVKPLHG